MVENTPGDHADGQKREDPGHVQRNGNRPGLLPAKARAAARRPQPGKELLLMVSNGLNAGAHCCADQRAFDWMVVINHCSGDAADDGASALAVMMAMSGAISRMAVNTVMGHGKRTAGREHQRHAQQGSLESLVRKHWVGTSANCYC